MRTIGFILVIVSLFFVSSCCIFVDRKETEKKDSSFSIPLAYEKVVYAQFEPPVSGGRDVQGRTETASILP